MYIHLCVSIHTEQVFYHTETLLTRHQNPLISIYLTATLTVHTYESRCPNTDKTNISRVEEKAIPDGHTYSIGKHSNGLY